MYKLIRLSLFVPVVATLWLSPGALAAQQTDPADADTASPPVSTGVPGDEELQDTTPAEPLSPEQAEEDEAIRSRLQGLYDRIGTLRDVEVDVEAGIVRLRGRALSVSAREQAVELASASEGVVFVEDRIRVVPDLGRRLDPTLSRIREFGIGAIAFLPLLGMAVLTVVLFVLAGVWASRWDGPHLRIARTTFIRGLLKQGIALAFTLAGILVALELLDATALVGAVLGTAGIFGLAVGFAFKDIVENHLAGIMLSLRQPFAPNDHLVVGSHEGKVVRLTARDTILMTLAGNHVRIPNAEIYRSIVTNYTRNPRRRFEVIVPIGPDEDLVAAQETALSVLRRMEGVTQNPKPSSRIRELGDAWVTLEFFGWVDQDRADFERVRSEAIRLVKTALDEAGVRRPSPEYAVTLREGEPEGGVEEKPGEKPEDQTPRPTPPRPATPQQDVSVDTTLDEQIDEERRTSDEDDLLEDR